MATKSRLGDDVVLPPVNSAVSEIRLIELQPGIASEPIICNYMVIALDGQDKVDYEALSYVWGQPDKDHQHVILLDGRKVTVTPSLFTALETLRQDEGIRRLWVDAVCINQQDDKEKTAQVNMMGRIYRSCSQCNFWLGLLGDVQARDAQDAMDVLRWLGRGGISTLPWIDDKWRCRGASLAMKAMMACPWWQRIWTVQETLLPPHGVIHWGPCRISWATMKRAADAFIEGTLPNNFRASKLDADNWNFDFTSQVRGLWLSLTEQPLQLVYRWRIRWATDPRDKVYALMGIRDDINLPSVRSCDYSVDVQTVYARATADMIRDCKDLRPLMGRRGELHTTKGLPSWALDLTRDQDTPRSKGKHMFWKYQTLYNSPVLDYTADRGIYGVREGLTMPDERTLCLHGRFVDQIAIVERPEDTEARLGTSSDLALLLSGSERWSKLLSRYQEEFSRPPPGDWMRALLGVVTGKLLIDGPECGKSVENWAADLVQRDALFITEKGRIGLSAWGVRPGQQVWVVGGSRWPLVLEPAACEKGSSPAEPCRDFTFFAECFVYGIMKGGAPGENVRFRLH